MHFKETEFGFEWGAAKITRAFSRDEWITLRLKTQKDTLQIYVTKTGKIRIHSENGKEWFKSK